MKLVFIGNSGAGKTGALTALVKAGYKVRILDMDNGLAALKAHILHECPEKIRNVDYQTFRDKFRATPQGPKMQGVPCIVSAIKALDKWDDGSTPAEWGTDTVFVLDSLTHFSNAAYNWAVNLNPLTKDRRQWYQEGQNLIEKILGMLTGEDFGPNVIVISHIDIREQKDGNVKGFAMALGEALGPKIPTYFNTLVLSETKGTGQQVKRTLKTFPTALLDLKNPAPFRVKAEYPIETGLADLFRDLRESASTKE